MQMGEVLFRKTSGAEILFDYEENGEIYGHIKNADGVEYPVKSLVAMLAWGYWEQVGEIKKFSPDQPRDEHGRFSFTENEGSVDDNHLPSEHAQAMIWDKARSMTDVSQAQDPEGFAGGIKEAVAKNILTEMQGQGITFEELYKNEIEKPPLDGLEKEQQEALKYILSDAKMPESGVGADYKIVIGSPGGGFTVFGGSRFNVDDNTPITREEFANLINSYPYFNNHNWAFMDSEDAKQVLSESKVSEYMKSWASSANDDNLTSLAMQEVAVKAFDLKDTASWDLSTTVKSSDVADEVQSNGKVYEAFLFAQYTATQEFFRENNISSLEVYRGVVGLDPNNPIPLGDNVEVTTRPLSSWTTNPDTANWFGSQDNVPAKFADKYNQGAIFHAIIPVSQVLSMPITGVGCYGENEVVLLGGTFTTDSEEWTGY